MQGPKNWRKIAQLLNSLNVANCKRKPKQCRERWFNFLDPLINRKEWTTKEDIRLVETVLVIGKKWSQVSKFLKGRTENSVKNRYSSLMKKEKKEQFLTQERLIIPEDEPKQIESAKLCNSQIPEVMKEEKNIANLISRIAETYNNEESDISESPIMRRYLKRMKAVEVMSQGKGQIIKIEKESDFKEVRVSKRNIQADIFGELAQNALREVSGLSNSQLITQKLTPGELLGMPHLMHMAWVKNIFQIKP